MVLQGYALTNLFATGITLQVAYNYADAVTGSETSSELSVPYEMVAMISHVRTSPSVLLQSLTHSFVK